MNTPLVLHVPCADHQAPSAEARAEFLSPADETLDLDRRSLLVLAGVSLGSLILAGCQSSPHSRTGSLSNRDRPVPLRPSDKLPNGSAALGSVSILPRSTWTRAGIARPKDAYPMPHVSRITVHHSGVEAAMLRTQADCTRMIENIRKVHVRNGWADIGYHYIIDPQGRVYAGRPANRQGAHVKDQNENNLGIMVLGNYDSEQPTAASLSSLQSMLAMQMRTYRVPLSRVYTHQELKSTACPGRSMQSQMSRIRSRSGLLAQAAAQMGLA